MLKWESRYNRELEITNKSLMVTTDWDGIETVTLIDPSINENLRTVAASALQSHAENKDKCKKTKIISNEPDVTVTETNQDTNSNFSSEENIQDRNCNSNSKEEDAQVGGDRRTEPKIVGPKPTKIPRKISDTNVVAHSSLKKTEGYLKGFQILRNRLSKAPGKAAVHSSTAGISRDGMKQTGNISRYAPKNNLPNSSNKGRAHNSRAAASLDNINISVDTLKSASDHKRSSKIPVRKVPQNVDLCACLNNLETSFRSLQTTLLGTQKELLNKGLINTYKGTASTDVDKTKVIKDPTKKDNTNNTILTSLFKYGAPSFIILCLVLIVYRKMHSDSHIPTVHHKNH